MVNGWKCFEMVKVESVGRVEVFKKSVFKNENADWGFVVLQAVRASKLFRCCVAQTDYYKKTVQTPSNSPKKKFYCESGDFTFRDGFMGGF